MVMLEGTVLVAMVVVTECQVNFPTSRPETPNNNPETPNNDDCKASNGQQGVCYEFRSNNFKECAFFPSIDSSDPEVANHLRANTCRNTGREVYFCCPSKALQEDPTPQTPPQRPSFIPSEVECGQSFRDNVVGGQITTEGDWPWLAAIGRKSGESFMPHCGGTLITKQFVISAAHCFNIRFQTTIVRLGEYDVNKPNNRAIDFDIVDERLANFNKVTTENDVILLKLDRPLTSFTDSIRAACLPYHLHDDNFEGKILTVVGWGVFDNNRGIISNVPQEGNVPVVPVQECQDKYNKQRYNKKIDDRQLCAGTGGTDSCNGDSGGPINYLDFESSRYFLVGIVSFGPRNCGSNNLPGVYARVGYYLNWIEENIREMILK